MVDCPANITLEVIMSVMSLLSGIGLASSQIVPYSQPFAEANFPDFIDPNVPSSRPYNVEEPQVFRISKPVAKVTDETVSTPVSEIKLMAGFMHALQLWHLETRNFIFKNVENSAKLFELDAKIQRAYTAYTGRDWEVHQAELPKCEQQPLESAAV
jgi:hypothetical protein